MTVSVKWESIAAEGGSDTRSHCLYSPGELAGGEGGKAGAAGEGSSAMLESSSASSASDSLSSSSDSAALRLRGFLLLPPVLQVHWAVNHLLAAFSIPDCYLIHKWLRFELLKLVVTKLVAVRCTML